MVKKEEMFFKKKVKNESKKPRAAVFVDFEHWYISLSKLHFQKPDIKKWRDTLVEEFDLTDIYFFADFANNTSLQTELTNISAITNCIIETGSNRVKDFTDFIMLDRIYQTAFERDDIDTYIIFSGDGHFASVVRFLTGKLGKAVGIYGVKNSINAQLQKSATWVRTVPEVELSITNLASMYYPILKNLDYLENDKKHDTKFHPTFSGTVDAVSRYYRLDPDTVRMALTSLIDNGFVYQKEIVFRDREMKELNVNWEKLIDAGLWHR